jgi:hypothetical protein
MTRRVIKPQPIDCVVELKEHSSILGYWIPYSEDNKLCNNNQGNRKNDCGYYCRYQVGDNLWVKETHYRYGIWVKNGITKQGITKSKLVQAWTFHATTDENLYYENPPKKLYPTKSRDEIYNQKLSDWYKRPSIFMPRWASRITLEITNIRVERLQEITEENARAEGCPGIATRKTYPRQYRDSFEVLWDRLNAKRGYSWGSNPWVWVIEFKKVMNK